MAKVGDEIVNPRTGQRMVFLETSAEIDGEPVRIDTFNPPTGIPEPEHLHPLQESGTVILSGSLRFRTGGEEKSVTAGGPITVPANTPPLLERPGPRGDAPVGATTFTIPISTAGEDYAACPGARRGHNPERARRRIFCPASEWAAGQRRGHARDKQRGRGQSGTPRWRIRAPVRSGSRRSPSARGRWCSRAGVP